MLDDNLLLSYINNYFNFGNLKSEYYFIGIEEGGGKDEKDIKNRLTAWEKLTKSELVDVYEYHKLINQTKYFDGKNINLVKTWGGMIRILLAILGKETSLEEAKKYQSKEWGRLNSNNFVGELLPLPNRSINDWQYNKLSKLEQLKSRKKYEDCFIDTRLVKLKSFIKKNKPKLVVFYGKKYLEYWYKIANKNFNEEKICNFIFKYCISSETSYAITAHPNSHGIPNEYFIQVGNFLRKNLIK